MLGWLTRSKRLLLNISIIIERDEPGYHAYCPGLKGLHVGGDTEEETFENAKQAVVAYLESLVKHGEPLPVGPDLTVEPYPEIEVPPGAFLRHIQLQWPTLNISGTR